MFLESRDTLHLGLHNSSPSDHVDQRGLPHHGGHRDVETQEEAGWQDGSQTPQKLAEGISVPCCDHGVNVDIWCADSGGGGTGPSGLHLHHPGGLPRCLHLHTLRGVRQESQRRLCQNAEINGQQIRPAQQLLQKKYLPYSNGMLVHGNELGVPLM